MGLPTWVKKQLKNRYREAFFKGDSAPPDVGVYVVDFMQYIKHVPKDIQSLEMFLQYLVNKVKFLLIKNNGHHTVIVCVDRDSPEVKKIVCYSQRYSKTVIYSEEDAPFLPTDPLRPLPDWQKFSSNRKLLQRELFPRLYNRLLDIDPGLGQRLILHGFPGRTQKFKQFHATWDNDESVGQAEYWANKRMVPVVVPWSPSTELPITQDMEREDPDLYNRIYIIEGIAPSPEFPSGVIRKEELPSLKNGIKEADLGILFYDHIYPNFDHVLCINDGDIFAISLLYTPERILPNGISFRNRHFIQLPNKKKKTKTKKDGLAQRKPAKFTYIDVNKLFCLVRDDKEFGKAGVQNHEVTLAFLLILAGTDFIKDHFKGIGKNTVVWKVFMEKLSMFSHLVMLSKNLIPDTRTYRDIVIDEDLFFKFISFCYIEKYGKAAKRKSKTKELNMKILKKHCSRDSKGNLKKDKSLHYPDRTTRRRWCRQILWNLLYWCNGMKGDGFEPDPFEKFNGQSYYGYLKPGSYSLTISAHQKPVDDFYKRHLTRYKDKRRNKQSQLNVSPSKKRKIVKDLAVESEKVFKLK